MTTDRDHETPEPHPAWQRFLEGARQWLQPLLTVLQLAKLIIETVIDLIP